MTDIIDFVQGNWDTILEVFAAVVALASVIVRLTPTPKDDEWLAKVLGFLSFLKPLRGYKVPLTPLKCDHEDCEHTRD